MILKPDLKCVCVGLYPQVAQILNLALWGKTFEGKTLSEDLLLIRHKITSVHSS